MCGIVGMFSRRDPIEEELTCAATKRLSHRGPDSQHHWISDDRRVALGHARLSIIDLRTGDQPLQNEDNRIHLVVNGEFYGYECLRQKLQKSGHRLATRSDSEIALHLYEEYGTQSLHHLRGEFAFILWDSRTRTLIAARDRFGIKPLFYSLHNQTLYLASEIKALFAAGVPARWDYESFAHAIEWGGYQLRTLYDGVFQVPPGHYLVATEKHVQLLPYWDFDYPAADRLSVSRSETDCIAEFRHALEEAVRLRLQADVPVGCYLSGGLDSCSVLGLAAKHSPRPLRAFTLTFARVEYDEEKEAREMAARVNADFCPIPISQDDLAEHFTHAILQSETLCFNAHGVAKYLLSRAVRNAGYKAVLTGEGSDEILGGYAHFRRDMLLYNQQGQNPGQVTEMLRQLTDLNPVSRGLLLPDGEARPLENVKRLLGFVPSWMETFSARFNKMQPLLSADFRQRCLAGDPYQALLSEIDIRGQLSGREPVHQALYLWSKTLLPSYVLTMLGDRMEMAHSIEGRVPFLDHLFVEVVRSLPVNLKIRGMTEKYVLRESVRDVITDTIYRRQKHPFLSPPAILNPESKLNLLVQDTLRSTAFAGLPFFDQKKVISLLDSLDEMDIGSRVSIDGILMILVSAAVLQEGFRLTR
ncbi:MAG: asparagine synthase (glutamine-hydrolyzing) [Acidobacteriaceae bacterium]|nr:asparagine synthase (glutamine-hydrolyzing) [Acidobacteriaceae bacterium]